MSEEDLNADRVSTINKLIDETVESLYSLKHELKQLSSKHKKRRLSTTELPGTSDICKKPRDGFRLADGYIVVTILQTNINGLSMLAVSFGDDNVLNFSEEDNRKDANIKICTRVVKIAYQIGFEKLRIRTNLQYVISVMKHHVNNWRYNGWKTREGNDPRWKEALVELDKASQHLIIDWVEL